MMQPGKGVYGKLWEAVGGYGKERERESMNMREYEKANVDDG